LEGVLPNAIAHSHWKGFSLVWLHNLIGSGSS